MPSPRLREMPHQSDSTIQSDGSRSSRRRVLPILHEAQSGRVSAPYRFALFSDGLRNRFKLTLSGSGRILGGARVDLFHENSKFRAVPDQVFFEWYRHVPKGRGPTTRNFCSVSASPTDPFLFRVYAQTAYAVHTESNGQDGLDRLDYRKYGTSLSPAGRPRKTPAAVHPRGNAST